MSAKILTKKELEKLINEGDKSVKFVQKKRQSQIQVNGGNFIIVFL